LALTSLDDLRTDGNPATNKAIRANGDDAFFGWPNSPQVEAEVAAWFDAKTLVEEKAAVRRLNKAALDHAVYCAARLVADASSLAPERHRHRQGAASVLLGVSKTV
jgi:peptide/nickel transport system substrate-binding protein